jgi:predicted ribosome quality control (RQC) complex YloA/Tae2 family protein
MKYKFLQEWTRYRINENLIVKEISKFEDQFFIFFRKSNTVLQLNYSSKNMYLFWTVKSKIPFLNLKKIQYLSTHLVQAKFVECSILENDRIVRITFHKTDIYNKKNELSLICELVPHRQNLILTKKENKKELIIDCWKKLSFAENRVRQILPNIEYSLPPIFFEINNGEIQYPLSIKNFEISENNDDESEKFTDINSAFEYLYYDEILLNQIQKLKDSKISQLKKIVKKKSKKIEKLEAEFKVASEEKKWKEWAELLKSNFNKIKKGNTEIKLINYYSEPFSEIKIPLFPEKNPRENIEYYFKKFKKARDGKIKIREQIDITYSEIEDLNKEIFDVQAIDDYDEIKNLFKINTKTGNKKVKKLKSIRINDRWEIIIGRTSKENDKITTKIAKPNDWWFHTNSFHGSHIILRNFNKKNPPEILIKICTALAAYFSKAKKSSNVPVDYTQIRYVNKPRGSAPGFVLYTHQKTRYVNPKSMREVLKIIEANSEL